MHSARKHRLIFNALLLAIYLACLLLSGCSKHHPAPIVERKLYSFARLHRVKAGETLYAIAWRYGRDYRKLARVNHIGPPYRIHPGQRIKLTKPSKQVNKRKKKNQKHKRALAKRSRNAKNKKMAGKRSNGKTKSTVGKHTSTSKKPLTHPKKTTKNILVKGWKWPASGHISKRFAKNAELKSNGINIAAHPGSKVLASAAGRVVYSGSGLRGYGKLLIIKHNGEFLSAYAHNHKLMVKEGDYVKVGQRIAEVGLYKGKGCLHFEIRKAGRPVDPLSYLPTKKS